MTSPDVAVAPVVFYEFVETEVEIPDHGPDQNHSLQHALYAYARGRADGEEQSWVRRGPLLIRAVEVLGVPPPVVDTALNQLVVDGHLYKPGPARYGVV